MITLPWGFQVVSRSERQEREKRQLALMHKVAERQSPKALRAQVSDREKLAIDAIAHLEAMVDLYLTQIRNRPVTPEQLAKAREACDWLRVVEPEQVEGSA